MADPPSDTRTTQKTTDTASDPAQGDVTRSERSAVSGLMLILLSLVVAFGAYFFVHVRQREMEISEHQLRLLQGAGGSVANALTGLKTSVANAFLVNPDDGAKGKKMSRDLYQKAIEAKLELVNGIEASDSNFVKREPRIMSLRPEVEVKDHVHAELRSILDIEAGIPRLVLVGIGVASGDSSRRVVRQSNLQTLLAETLPTQFFDGVLLARSNGDVLLQQGTSEVRIQHIEPPPPKTAKDSKLPLTATAVGSMVYDLPIASQKYKVFAQRISLPIAIYSRGSPEEPWRCEKDWQVIGFLSASRFSGATMQISPAIVLIAICFVVFGLLSLPILKVRFLGPREELRYVDVIVLAFAVLVSAALATFAIGYYAMHESLAENTERQLDSLSTGMRRRFAGEVARLDRTLIALTDLRSDSTAAIRPSLLLDSATVESIQRSDSTGRLTPFEQVFWVGSKGQQTGKWGVRTTNTSLINVKARTYYRLPTQDMVWPGGAASSSLLPGQYLESIRSLTTGRESAVLARRLRAEEADTLAAIEARLQSVISPVMPPDHGFAIVNRSGDVQFHSDHVRNLRENFFRELEASGAIREAVEARQSVTARTEYRTVPSVLHVAPITGTPWSLIVFVDARRSRLWLISTLTTAIGAYGMYVIVMMLFGWATRWMHGPPRPGEARRLWFWPRKEHEGRYSELILWLGGAILICAGVILVFDSRIVLWVCTLGPLCLVARIIFTTKPLTGSPQPAHDTVGDQPVGPRRRGWGGLKAHLTQPSELYRLALILSVLLVGVIPAAGTLRAVSLEAERLRLRGEQLTYANAIRARQREQRDWFRGVPAVDTARRAIERAVFGSTSHSDEPGFNTPPGWRWTFHHPHISADSIQLHAGLAGNAESSPVLSWLQAFLGRHGTLSIWSHSYPEYDSASVWSRSRTGHVVGLFPEIFTSGDVTSTSTSDTTFRVLRIDAAPTTFRLPWLYFLWVMVLGIGGLIALIGVVRMTYRWVALGDMEPVPVLRGDHTLDLKPDHNGALTIPGIRRALFIRFSLHDDLRKRWSRIDVHDVRQADTMAMLVAKIPWNAEGIVISRFDHGLKEPGMVQKKLELLERLEFERPLVPVVIETQVEPLNFLVARFQDHFVERESLGIDVVRWTSALGPYTRHRVPPDPRANPGCSADVQSASAVATPEPWEIAVRSETDCDEGLHECLPRLKGLGGIEGLNRQQVVMAVMDMATPYYRRIWSCCSTEEKLLLYRVAREGVVNHRAIRTLRPLLRRGLIRMDPNPRIMNESFRQFVLDAERPEVFAKWQARGGLSPWARMRTPIVLSISVLGTFFFATQREVLDQSLALMATLAASAPGVLSLLSGFGQLRQGGAKK